MTTETPVSVDPQSAQLQRIWVDCLQKVLGQVAGFPVTVEPSSGEDPAPKVPAALEKPPACMVITASKALQGDMAIVTSEAGALALAQVLVTEQLNAAVPFDKDHRDAFEELLRQVLGQVATSLKQAAGGEVDVKPSGSEVPSWTDASSLKIRITGEKLQPIELTLIVSPELVKSLQSHPEPKEPPAQKAQAPSAPPPSPPATPPTPPSAPKAQPAPPPPPTPAPSGGSSSNLDLLLDVRLDATIRFGQKQMLLREILELHPGTAIALDRQVQEPVELLVGGQVVAQGEVVIVDGNYGLRITEILSPHQRIESLGKQR
ncbi:MAG TPA: FliM/FliN family flagellar motor switch protein [Verrucomicrobiae bacterium]|nr:FliM/FliN family flagellar motor switch protein [Verrucomicrobiae bacterium]